ncbi:MAG: hypothetical protein E7812_15610 [Phenylobacterium sp.]|nr:MAG: hypothetical protein E7812_15610 [Phenylobacterium sp.]
MTLTNRIASLIAFLALSCLVGTAAKAMTFTLIPAAGACVPHPCILADGDIDERSVGAFSAFTRQAHLGPGALVVLNSPGGNVLQSLMLGKAIRQQGFSTTVQGGGACASACAFVFLGGVERSAGPSARIGVHQISNPASALGDLSAADGEWLVSLVAVYVKDMGGDLSVLIPALRTAPCDMHWLSPSELSRYAVVTKVAAD